MAQEQPGAALSRIEAFSGAQAVDIPPPGAYSFRKTKDLLAAGFRTLNIARWLQAGHLERSRRAGRWRANSPGAISAELRQSGSAGRRRLTAGLLKARH